MAASPCTEAMIFQFKRISAAALDVPCKFGSAIYAVEMLLHGQTQVAANSSLPLENEEVMCLIGAAEKEEVEGVT